jgi:protein-L-isoaspartate(D-aspartate) O-methyltransferase
MELDLFLLERERMVSDQIKRRGLNNPRLLQAFRTVPRHQFVPSELEREAYADYPLQIGHGQTISQPYIVALMTSLLGLEGNEKVLEIGTGSGYQAAILAQMAKTVHTVECLPDLAENAQKTLHQLKYQNIYVHQGDGSNGWIDDAPYQGILVTAASPEPPQPLLDQLDENARLIIPIGPPGEQQLQVWQRENGSFSFEAIIPVVFVLLRGKYGWKNPI